MTKINQKYINYLYPGIIVAEQSRHEVESFDIPKTIPRHAFAFYFSEQDIIMTDEGQVFKSKEVRHDPKYIIGTRINLDDIPDTPENQILRSNISCNSKLKQGIKTHVGNWTIADDSVVLDVKQFKLKN